MVLRKSIKLVCILTILFLTLFPTYKSSIAAESINWEEVASTSEGIQYIDTGSLKYKEKGILSILTQYSKINPDSEEVIDTYIYEMDIDCEKRLYRDISLNGISQKGSNWKVSSGDKLTKKTIIKSCSY